MRTVDQIIVLSMTLPSLNHFSESTIVITTNRFKVINLLHFVAKSKAAGTAHFPLKT